MTCHEASQPSIYDFVGHYWGMKNNQRTLQLVIDINNLLNTLGLQEEPKRQRNPNKLTKFTKLRVTACQVYWNDISVCFGENN